MSSADEDPRLEQVRSGRLYLGPETLQLNLGNACNLDCIFCWNHSPLVEPRPAAWQRQRLSDAHLDAVLADLPRLAPARVLLSGWGEPLLHPRAEELLARLGALGIPAVMQTNGTTGPRPERLAELGVEMLHVDISAATRAGYARVHPEAGAELYDQVIARLEAIAALGRPKLTLVAVIQTVNAGELLQLVELAARVSAEAVYLKGLELAPGLESLRIEGAAAGKLLGVLTRAHALAAERGVRLDSVHLEQLLRRQDGAGRFTQADDASSGGDPSGDGPPRAPARCYLGWYYLRVTCDGRVMFCCKDKPVGHLDEASLYRIWRSPGYHLARLAGRDGQAHALFDDQLCARCSNFAKNRALAAALE